MFNSMPVTHPLSKAALRSAWAWSGALGLCALFAGAVRILPWVLDPEVPARVALPFARGIVELATEAALLVGWPLGWALAAHRFADRGEARAMMLLGESPIRTALAQWRSAAPLAALLAVASATGAFDAGAPGRMAQDLVTQGRAACASVKTPRTFAVPFVDATWLCPGPGPAPATGPATPVLYGAGPGSLRSIVFTAKGARIAPDMRRIELDDARFSVGSAKVHAGRVALHGMSPWTHASNVPPLLRALVVVLAAALAALGSVVACLAPGRLGGTFAAVVVGVSGPLVALGLMRALERADAPAGWFLLTPIASAVFPAALAVARRGC
jgi:hypothetical protein